ncbi:MAG TPA: MerR family transcriptional regulator [Victivallis vadensis]|nr:MerR family transcriptional regulator [Victivallis vadensis]
MAGIRPFAPSKDRTPGYAVKEVSELTGFSAYTIRYYENSGLIPSVDGRQYPALSWLRLVHCLRATGLPIDQVRHYIRMCEQGDSTIPERAEMIFRQAESLCRQLESDIVPELAL